MLIAGIGHQARPSVKAANLVEGNYKYTEDLLSLQSCIEWGGNHLACLPHPYLPEQLVAIHCSAP